MPQHPEPDAASSQQGGAPAAAAHGGASPSKSPTSAGAASFPADAGDSDDEDEEDGEDETDYVATPGCDMPTPRVSLGETPPPSPKPPAKRRHPKSRSLPEIRQQLARAAPAPSATHRAPTRAVGGKVDRRHRRKKPGFSIGDPVFRKTPLAQQAKVCGGASRFRVSTLQPVSNNATAVLSAIFTNCSILAAYEKKKTIDVRMLRYAIAMLYSGLAPVMAD